MKAFDVDNLTHFYRNYLQEQIIPFWLDNAVDWEFGGYFTFLDRTGAVLNHDKICAWNCGRMIWVFAFLYNEFHRDQKLLQASEKGFDFGNKFGFSPEGRMFYSLTRTGEPLEESQDVFAELFWVLGLSELAIARDDAELFKSALEVLEQIWKIIQDVDTSPNPFVSATRPVRMHGPYLITLNVAQSMRKFQQAPVLDDIIGICIDYITRFFTDREKKIVYEIKQADGQPIPGEFGRWICPGHMIEAGIFLVKEGEYRNDPDLIKNGVDFIDWGFSWGWDKEHGGLCNDVSIDGKPFGRLRTGMIAPLKLWWQHTEALHGLLLAYAKTGDEKFLHQYWMTHDYCVKHFDDPNGLEWFSMLDPRGNVLNSAKGSERKSAFHITRNFLQNLKLLQSMSR